MRLFIHPNLYNNNFTKEFSNTDNDAKQERLFKMDNDGVSLSGQEVHYSAMTEGGGM